MAEQPRAGEQQEQQKNHKIVRNMPHICMDAMKHAPREVTSTPTSPVSALRKTSSVRQNCLCSPTTHVGSFRCRFHRAGPMSRNSMSVGAKLNELADDK